jgi:hypothetical protein
MRDEGAAAAAVVLWPCGGPAVSQLVKQNQRSLYPKQNKTKQNCWALDRMCSVGLQRSKQ